jgi:putative ABC transport system ATP-binding protein
MINIQNLKVIFSAGTPDENIVLKNLGLKINQGDFITLIGSNGAGKSTLFNALAGNLIPQSGEILMEDANTKIIRNIIKDPEYKRARYIGRIFQNPLMGTAGKMTLADNMMICLNKGYKGLKISLNKTMKESFREKLRVLDMGLENRLNDNVELFSGGQRQALTLLMTVLSKPSLLLLDEHTAALDPRNAEMIMELTLKFAREYHLTVMMITHNIAHALEFGNRLVMMDQGEIILDIDAAEKSKLSADDIVQRFRDIKKQELQNDKMLLR